MKDACANKDQDAVKRLIHKFSDKKYSHNNCFLIDIVHV